MQFQGRAYQILFTKDHHLTSVKVEVPLYLCKHTTSKRKKIEDRAWRHFNKAGYTATLVACGWAGAAKKN